MIKAEAYEQTTLFSWAAYQQCIYPELALLFHIPNGGSRNKIEAANLKRQGVKAGVPDLCLPIARGSYHGMFIELKATGGRLSPHQKEWLSRLTEQGYLAVCCTGFESARDAIINYLNRGS